MNQIATIVNLVLENHDGSCLDNEAERDHIANAIASKLTLASLQQLAAHRYHRGDEAIYEDEVVTFLRYKSKEVAEVELPNGKRVEVWLDELDEPGAKAASTKTARKLHKRHEKVLAKYLKSLGSRATYVQDYDDLPEPVLDDLQRIKW